MNADCFWWNVIDLLWHKYGRHEVKRVLGWRKKRKELSRQLSWFRVTKREEKHQHQRSTTMTDESNTIRCLNFPSEMRFSSYTSHFLSVVSQTRKEKQMFILKWQTFTSEQCYLWLHVTAQLCSNGKNKAPKGDSSQKMQKSWNEDNTI